MFEAISMIFLSLVLYLIVRRFFLYFEHPHSNNRAIWQTISFRLQKRKVVNYRCLISCNTLVMNRIKRSYVTLQTQHMCLWYMKNIDHFVIFAAFLVFRQYGIYDKQRWRIQMDFFRIETSSDKWIYQCVFILLCDRTKNCLVCDGWTVA